MTPEQRKLVAKWTPVTDYADVTMMKPDSKLILATLLESQVNYENQHGKLELKPEDIQIHRNINNDNKL